MVDRIAQATGQRVLRRGLVQPFTAIVKLRQFRRDFLAIVPQLLKQYWIDFPGGRHTSPSGSPYRSDIHVVSYHPPLAPPPEECPPEKPALAEGDVADDPGEDHIAVDAAVVSVIIGVECVRLFR